MEKFHPPAGQAGRLRAARPGNWRGNRRGIAATEFALVALPATVMMFAVFEVSWQVCTLAALDHAALRASRFGTTGLAAPVGRTGVPTCRSSAIPWFASAVTGGFLRADRLTVSTDAYATFGGAAARVGGVSGAGAGGQMVSYTLTYRQPWLTGGMAQLVTGASEMTYRSTLTVKNEPFENGAENAAC